MSDERRIEFSAWVRTGGKVEVPTRAEELRAALALLARALDVPSTASLPDLCPNIERATAEELAYKGIALVLHALPHLAPETALELKTFAVRAVKKFLPVEVRWHLFDETRNFVGTVGQHVSQRTAEKEFGLQELR
jgi:hypothetical protein